MKQAKSRGQMIFRYFLILFLFSGFLIAKLLWPFISILVLAFVLAGIFYPVYSFLTKKIRPSLASFLTCLLIFQFVLVPTVFLVRSLSQEAFSLYQMSKGMPFGQQMKDLLQDSSVANKIEELLERYDIDMELDSKTFNETLSDLGKDVGLFLYQQASSIASNILQVVINFLIMLMIIFFLFLDGKEFIDFLVDLSPLPAEQDRELLGKFHEMAGAILVGNGLAGVCQGILGGVAFALFGLSSPFLWGAIMAIMAFLPIVGISVVFAPAAVYLFLKGRITAGILLLIVYVVITIFIEYLLKPKLVGQKVKMHTLLVILSILGGLKVFGILGIIYGPLIVTAFLTLTKMYRTNYEAFVRDE
ncbi:MAG: AI-2E family transporter [Desulfobacteria bacterium]